MDFLRTPDPLTNPPYADIRYEVEVQLGATDESHIIRTIEYWDVERKRYPNYDHVAVIVAEDITSRFFNVISLFNSAIPLIAIKLTAVENPDGTVGILFTRILDLVQQSSPDDDEPTEQTNRAYWDKKSSEAMLRNVDAIVEQIKTFEPKANLSYNKFYCGIWVDGRADNFVLFRPRRQFFHMEVKLPRSTEVDQMLEEVGLEFEPPRKDGRYRIRLDKKPDEKVLAVIREILSRSYQE